MIELKIKGLSQGLSDLYAVLHVISDSLKTIAGSAECDPKQMLITKGGNTTFELAPFVFITTQPSFNEEETKMGSRTYTLADDQADFGYSFEAVGQVQDAEGANVAKFTEESESSDTSVISLVPTDPANPLEGNVHVGAPGVATVTRSLTAKVGRKDVKFPFDVTTFVITSGAPVSVTTGGGTTFTGVDADPVEPPVVISARLR